VTNTVIALIIRVVALLLKGCLTLIVMELMMVVVGVICLVVMIRVGFDY